MMGLGQRPIKFGQDGKDICVMKGPGQGPNLYRSDVNMELYACNALHIHWLEHHRGATCLG
jgi:hypothetical protein